MILLIDNYDSFTWNLYQYFCELGAEVLVRRNDELTLADIIALAPAKIVISPGPCTPDESGFRWRPIRHFSGQTPILGVCPRPIRPSPRFSAPLSYEPPKSCTGKRPPSAIPVKGCSLD